MSKYSKALIMWYVITILVLGAIAAFIWIPDKGYAQERDHEHRHLAERALMTRVVLNRLTIWTNPNTGRITYASACRRAPEGCERRISLLVDYIYNASARYNFHPWLAAGVAWHESRFNAFAESHAHARGYFQILARSPWANGLPFVRQRWFRNRCRTIEGACQEPIADRAISLLSRIVVDCGSVRRGLGMYNTGRCNRGSRYARVVLRARDGMVREAQNLRFGGPGDHYTDDGAEPTLEEIYYPWCSAPLQNEQNSLVCHP